MGFVIAEILSRFLQDNGKVVQTGRCSLSPSPQSVPPQLQVHSDGDDADDESREDDSSVSTFIAFSLLAHICSVFRFSAAVADLVDGKVLPLC